MPVQGPGAALGIAHGLKRLARVPEVDVIIVARGGGSLEDLWAFNEEPLARAIAARHPDYFTPAFDTEATRSAS